jgi:hypothetical protein
MIWIVLISGIVAGMATASLLGSYKTRRDLATGRPDYLSLADYTGIFDRQELAQLYGPPDAVDRYTVSRDTAPLPRRLWSRLLDSMALDVVCIIAAPAAAFLAANKTPSAWWVLALVCGYQVVSWAVAAWMVSRKASWPEDDKAIH